MGSYPVYVVVVTQIGIRDMWYVARLVNGVYEQTSYLFDTREKAIQEAMIRTANHAEEQRKKEPTADQIIDEALKHPGVKLPSRYGLLSELCRRVNERAEQLSVIGRGHTIYILNLNRIKRYERTEDEPVA